MTWVQLHVAARSRSFYPSSPAVLGNMSAEAIEDVAQYQ
jgi:hypothetical protein